MYSKDLTDKDGYVKAIKPGGTGKFIILSLIGTLMFFMPIAQGKVPVVYLVGLCERLAGKSIRNIAVVSNLLLAVSLAGSSFFSGESGKKLRDYHENDGPVKKMFFCISILVVLLVLADAPLGFVRNPEIGGKILTMASTIFVTIALAGSLVIFIIKSGIVEFVSVLLEPVMRPVFLLPGEAAVNMISSFVSSASVGVFFTEQYYEKGTYTRRQACAVVTNFSVVSVGYIGVLASIAGIEELYGTLLVSTFLLVLLMGAVMVRIPPMSLIGDRCIDGSRQEVDKAVMGVRSRFEKALKEGRLKSEEFTLSAFLANAGQAMMFAQKTIGVMIPTVAGVLVVVHYTPLFTWLGYPLVPIIRLLGIPDAAAIAPSVLIGIVEISLPSILISGGVVAKASAFFIVQLSIVQIIFFSEAGNAILSSRIPLKAGTLIQIFLVRTMVAMPLVALLTHILF